MLKMSPKVKKGMKYISIFVGVIILIFAILIAQEQYFLHKKRDRVSKILPPKAKYKHGYKLETTYDKFKGYTNVELDIPLPNQGMLMLFNTYKGKTQTEMQIFIHALYIGKVDCSLPHQITFLGDDSVKASLDEKLMPECDEKSISGIIIVDDFGPMSAAKKIDLKIGETEYPSNDSIAAAIKDFASRLK